MAILNVLLCAKKYWNSNIRRQIDEWIQIVEWIIKLKMCIFRWFICRLGQLLLSGVFDGATVIDGGSNLLRFAKLWSPVSLWWWGWRRKKISIGEKEIWSFAKTSETSGKFGEKAWKTSISWLLKFWKIIDGRRRYFFMKFHVMVNLPAKTQVANTCRANQGEMNAERRQNHLSVSFRFVFVHDNVHM